MNILKKKAEILCKIYKLVNQQEQLCSKLFVILENPSSSAV
jgi:hypothetical protein